MGVRACVRLAKCNESVVPIERLIVPAEATKALEFILVWFNAICA
jgi:hypothetical protein